MRKGFLFYDDRCVACGACKAGCFIENGWQINVREIFTEKIFTSATTLTTNLSLACNHCENAVCMEGCPALCYSRDSGTGAVIIDQEKCLGCKYCTWNCPYDAPKFDETRRVIIKCNFCNGRLTNGSSPACSLACPTGALAFGEIKPHIQSDCLSFSPDKDLNPSIELTGSKNNKPLAIIPGNRFDLPESDIPARKIIAGDWSLIVFTFITMLSVSFTGISLMSGFFPGTLALGILLLLAIIASLFHLGKWSRAWRAVSNIKGSPLSREILLFMLFASFSLSASFFMIPFLMPVSAITGLFLLITIDRVYLFADNRKELYLHSGQTFAAALLVISFTTGMTIPFIFIAFVRLASSFYLYKIRNKQDSFQLLRFFRIAALLLAGASLIRGNNYREEAVIGLLLTGELIDRILFYADFNPVNIKTSVRNQIN